MDQTVHKPCLTILLVLSLGWVADASRWPQERKTPLVLGLDHVVVAVQDLKEAAERYRELGFVLKPGRPHENGIRNQHAKFEDGTEIELLTASEARDALTAEYLRHLVAGDGPAFVALHAPEMIDLAHHFDAVSRMYRKAGTLLSFPAEDETRYIFFGGLNHSPTDRPEHFRHANGSESLVAVWIAGEDLAAERELMRGLGAELQEQETYLPDRGKAVIARFSRGEVVFLPRGRQTVPGRRIVGATVQTRDLKALRKVLAGKPWESRTTASGRSVFVPPDVAHGIWLEFRESR